MKELFLILIFTQLLFLCDKKQDKSPPNIILILTDQQNANMMSAVGTPYLHTPTMDELAQQDVLFTQTFIILLDFFVKNPMSNLYDN